MMTILACTDRMHTVNLALDIASLSHNTERVLHLKYVTFVFISPPAGHSCRVHLVILYKLETYIYFKLYLYLMKQSEFCCSIKQIKYVNRCSVRRIAAVWQVLNVFAVQTEVFVCCLMRLCVQITTVCCCYWGKLAIDTRLLLDKKCFLCKYDTIKLNFYGA